MIRPTLIDVNHFKHNYYSFIISLDKCNGSCNVVGDLFTKSTTKDGNAKVFNI